MEVVNTTVKKRKTKGTINLDSTPVPENDPAYQRTLSMYVIPPTEEITLDDFENWSFDRLTALKGIENLRLSGKKGTELENAIDSLLHDHLQLRDVKKFPEDVRKDVVSHFILRLAFCKPNDRKWFIKHEALLLRHRLRNVDLRAFLRDNNIQYDLLPQPEFKELQTDLYDVYSLYRKTGFSEIHYYKVPFEEALDLVKHRKALVRKGIAYVPSDEMPSIIASRFKAHLKNALTEAAKAFGPAINKFDSVLPVLSSLAKGYVASEYKVDTKSVTNGKVELGQIDMIKLAKRSYPLCMRNLHSKLRENHHLKHMARMQYGLFLKGIGLTLQDALTFWRNEFTQHMSSDKFNTSYAYNIRHNYGKEGRRADYTPYSCVKIIMGKVNSDEHHGCPFKNWDPDHFKRMMSAQGVSSSDANEIIELKNNQHYQIACRKYFEVTHPNCKNDIVISHPNQYFDESERYYAAQNGITPGQPAPVISSTNYTNPTNEPKAAPVL